MANLKDLVFVDIETTGGKLHQAEITEIALIHISDGEEVGRYQTLLKPQKSIPPWITRLTGISNAMVMDAPSFAEIAEELAAWLSHKTFVAHNARFDYGFIKAAFKQVGLDFKAPVICSVKLSRQLFPEAQRHGLDQIIEHFQLTCDARHRAMGDAEMIWQFFQKLPEYHSSTVIEQALLEQLKQPSLPPNLDAETLENCPDSPGVYRFYNAAGTVIYVGKSVTLRTRILSHFSAGQQTAKDHKITQEIAHIDWTECSGDLGAQLLEAREVKRISPTYNVRLRKTTHLWRFALSKDAAGYNTLILNTTSDLSPAELIQSYGLYRSKKQALEDLEKRVAQHQLCQRLTGLEKKKSGTCFAFQLKRCKGACVGQEKPELYNLRLEMALQPLKQKVWPWKTPILVKEMSENIEQIHLIDQWCWLGSADNESDLEDLITSKQEDLMIELDTYKILCNFLLKPNQALQITQLRR
ncbi:exonuclease domain-containing protein [Thiosulfativibrio zosterae]|uniref:Excinuclease cho n=1 Tax=Thiosulfativibrio zosterae TaxID=2675053 RepID=A0A6F8PMV7_9GAMM|nr:exonuclease domain-containing protein [Thiosulfativibrio zosterae]BBP43439.1 hypothetical protein THMIRHAT_11850 [Thiosulfativibrio zosterae]